MRGRGRAAGVGRAREGRAGCSWAGAGPRGRRWCTCSRADGGVAGGVAPGLQPALGTETESEEGVVRCHEEEVLHTGRVGAGLVEDGGEQEMDGGECEGHDEEHEEEHEEHEEEDEEEHDEEHDEEHEEDNGEQEDGDWNHEEKDGEQEVDHM